MTRTRATGTMPLPRSTPTRPMGEERPDSAHASIAIDQEGRVQLTIVIAALDQ